MSDEQKYDGEIPWDKMSSEDAGKVAKLQAFGSVSLNFATGVTALIVSIVGIYFAQSGKDSLQTQINSLVMQVGDLSASNRSLTEERNDLKRELGLVRDMISERDRRIEFLEKRERHLIERIEELEKQLKS